MRALKKLMNYPMMWRTSHGYGVHSPFAFNFITKVIGEKDAEYYAYAEIAAFCPRARKAGFNEIFAGQDMSVPEAWMLFRVLCHFHPENLLEVGHGHEVTNIIFNRAVPKTKIHVWHPDRHPDPALLGKTEPFVLINQFHTSYEHILEKYISQLLEKGESIYFVRNLDILPKMAQLWKFITSMTDFGMGFTDGYTGIFVARRGLPHQIHKLLM